MRPRASRIPGIRDQELSARSLFYSSRVSKWLEDDHLVRGGRATNWKRQYKLRHNWSKGSCSVTETQVAKLPSIPPLLVRLHGCTVVVADSTGGLRAYHTMGKHHLVASTSWPDNEGSLTIPTSLAIDVSTLSTDILDISVGFSDGRFMVYRLDNAKRGFTILYTHAPSSNGAVSAIAFASPYLLTMTDAQLLSLYIFPNVANNDPNDLILGPPHLLSSLKSHTAWPPLVLSIRASTKSIYASIAYSMPTYLAGWSVGLQELRLATDGRILESRLASAVNQGFVPLFMSSPSSSRSSPRAGSSPAQAAVSAPRPPSTRPTSLSYTHPYLLAAHPDNTLTLYLVTSNAESLSIGAGERLWGHTSSVSGAQVGDRGKAVSVSAHGNEIRVWNLEGGFSSNSSKRRVAAGEASVQVRPERKKDENGREESEMMSRYNFHPGYHGNLDPEDMDREELTITKNWVGFDDEKVVLLREKMHGAQNLAVYDFT